MKFKTAADTQVLAHNDFMQIMSSVFLKAANMRWAEVVNTTFSIEFDSYQDPLQIGDFSELVQVHPSNSLFRTNLYRIAGIQFNCSTHLNKTAHLYYK